MHVCVVLCVYKLCVLYMYVCDVCICVVRLYCNGMHVYSVLVCVYDGVYVVMCMYVCMYTCVYLVLGHVCICAYL